MRLNHVTSTLIRRHFYVMCPLVKVTTTKKYCQLMLTFVVVNGQLVTDYVGDHRGDHYFYRNLSRIMIRGRYSVGVISLRHIGAELNCLP